MILCKKPIVNMLGKGEYAGYQHFLLFPKCFLPYRRQKIIILAKFILWSATGFSLVKAKILSFGKELTSLLKIYSFVQIEESVDN